MDIEYTSAQKQFRAEVRDWLNAHAPKERLPSFDTAEGFELHRNWERTLAKDRWGNVNWPEQYGGRGLDLISWLIFEEEYYRADAPLRVSQNGIFLLAPTIMEYGTEAQKARFLPPMASGDEIWAQAWSAGRRSLRRDGTKDMVIPGSICRLVFCLSAHRKGQ